MVRTPRSVAAGTATALALVLASTSLATSGATAQPAGAENADDLPPSEIAGAPTTQSVTLLTGDKVVLGTLGDTRTIDVEPAPDRTEVSFIEQQTEDGQLRVIPSDALERVAAGQLDVRLFDVTGLIEQGYDDASAEELPLIVEYDDGPRAEASASAELTAAGADVQHELPSIGGAAVRVPKESTAQLWDQLSSSTVEALDAGIAGVRLDGKVAAVLDESVPMIGAPTAWDAGYTGDGVRVAVLDTGLDANHPDMAGAVAAAEDFSYSDSGTADLFGHGTHVSSIVSGTGSASDGRYAGVAPDADLLVGKVLDDFGGGYESWIIAGMQWAVDQGADVVNMSLGGCATDGSSPMDEALNTLTEQSGALFVVAAGNHPAGLLCSFPEKVSSPAAADRAVAVGSVNKQGELSEFSNTGPRVGDAAVKPELVAPGESIVAARAEGTLEYAAVDDHYAELSGTSMAAPHVAGVAALLAEQHPDWKASELAPALLGSAIPRPGLGAYQQGAGLVDAGRAVAQQVVASPASLSMGLAEWPHDDDEPIAKTLTYRNTGDEAISFDLSVTAFGEDGTPAPDGIFDVTPTEVTVPAGGDTDITITADTSIESRDGAFSGRVRGETDDGTVLVTTPIGVVKEVESYDLTIDAIDRNGEPAWTLATLGDLAAQKLRDMFIEGEPVTLRLPAGHYDLTSVIITTDPGGPAAVGDTLAAAPEINLDRDMAVTLDARDGRPVRAIVDSPTARPRAHGMFLDTYRLFHRISTRSDSEFYATPTSEVTAYEYTFGYQGALSEPLPHGDDRKVNRQLSRGYQLYLTENGRIPDPTFRVRDSELARLDTSVHSQGVADQQIATLDAYPTRGDEWVHGQSYDVLMPSKRIDFYSDAPDLGWATDLRSPNVEEYDYGGPYLQKYQAGKRFDKHWNAAPLGPVLRPRFFHGGFYAGLWPFSSSADLHATFSGWDGIEMSTTVKKNGEVVGTSDEPDGGFYDLPSEPAAYEITMTGRRDVGWSHLGTQVDATWSVTAGPDEETGILPMLFLRISGDLDLLNRASANRPLKLELRGERSDRQEPAVRNASLQVSFDDGITWQDVRLRPVRDGFTALVPRPPKGSEFVSLRASAEDADGSHVEQTVIRAYQLAGP